MTTKKTLPKVQFQDLGVIPYAEAWDYQTTLQQSLAQRKVMLRQENLPYSPPEHHFLLFCEHPHVYTLGKSGSAANVLLSDEELKENNIEFFKINRGGDITYHGFGQIVGYPIFDLDDFSPDVHRYVRNLEEGVIRTLADFGIEGYRIKDYTGVWVGGNTPTEGGAKQRKICAIGVHISRWVTLHGFAFNVNTQLNFFNNIIPCGIAETDKAVTSLAKELKQENVDIATVKAILKRHLAIIFGFEFL
jgi:lipoyl(octanoyl) transferase